MTVSASFLSRLAVALLVAMGFAVPFETVQRDEVVQGVPRAAAVEVAEAVEVFVVVAVAHVEVFFASQRVADSERLFVKHRALLI